MRMTIGELRQIIREEVTTLHRRRRLYEGDIAAAVQHAQMSAEAVIAAVGMQRLQALASSSDRGPQDRNAEAAVNLLKKKLGSRLGPETSVILLAKALLSVQKNQNKPGYQLPRDEEQVLIECGIEIPGYFSGDRPVY